MITEKYKCGCIGTNADENKNMYIIIQNPSENILTLDCVEIGQIRYDITNKKDNRDKTFKISRES